MRKKMYTFFDMNIPVLAARSTVVFKVMLEEHANCRYSKA
jgi:hypothetical protein